MYLILFWVQEIMVVSQEVTRKQDKERKKLVRYKRHLR